jgi:hypothetical protein
MNGRGRGFPYLWMNNAPEQIYVSTVGMFLLAGDITFIDAVSRKFSSLNNRDHLIDPFSVNDFTVFFVLPFFVWACLPPPPLLRVALHLLATHPIPRPLYLPSPNPLLLHLYRRPSPFRTPLHPTWSLLLPLPPRLIGLLRRSGKPTRLSLPRPLLVASTQIRSQSSARRPWLPRPRC